MIKVGAKVPTAIRVAIIKHSATKGFETSDVDFSEYCEGKNLVVIGYPGAFAPTCMSRHIPDFISNAEKIKNKGADEILALSVNDPFVVTAFAEYLGGKHLINFIADGNGFLSKALGLTQDLS